MTLLFFDLFDGVLALFLLQMGMIVASKLGELRRLGSFMLAFGVARPLVGGTLARFPGLALGLSTGGHASEIAPGEPKAIDQRIFRHCISLQSANWYSDLYHSYTVDCSLTRLQGGCFSKEMLFHI